jgi:hypothetical protein
MTGKRKLKTLIKERLGVVKEKTRMMTESARRKAKKTTTTKMIVECQGTTSKREVGKWWKGLLTNLRRRMITTTKGTKNVVPIGKKSREYTSALGK